MASGAKLGGSDSLIINASSHVGMLDDRLCGRGVLIIYSYSKYRAMAIITD